VADFILKVDGLSKNFGEVLALNQVGFNVRPNEILGLIGPNGAGKTTLLECVAGILHFDSGSIAHRGGHFARPKDRLFYLPDGVRPYAELTCDEALDLFCAMYSVGCERKDELIKKLDLSAATQRRVGSLSKGTLKRLLLAMGLLTPQPLLLLDEPFDGLDLRQTRAVMALLREARDRPRTLLLSIHQLVDAERVCDRFLLLKDGRLVGSGTLDELKAGAAGQARNLEEAFLALT